MLRKCKPELPNKERVRERDKDTAFYNRLSEKEVETISLARRAANESIDEFKRERSNFGDDMNEEETITSLLKIVDQAWKQCIKYSLMSSLRMPDAYADTNQGKGVRQ